MTNHPSPTAARSSKFTKDTCSGKESHGTQVKGLRHLCERCKEARPNGARQVQSLHATLGKGPMHPCERGKYDRSRKGPKKQGQISRQDRPTGDVSKALRWNVTTSWSSKGGKKESLKGHLKSCTVQPFPLESTSTVLG